MNKKKKEQAYSIVIPILNEGKNLEELVTKIKKNLAKFKFEIIFIDDNSKDDSLIFLKKLKKKYNFLKYFIRKKKPDLSLSCIYGFNKSRFDNIIVMDGDLQHDPKYLPRMIKIFKDKNLDFVVAARNFRNFSIPGLSMTRLIASKILIYIFFIFVGTKTTDPMSGFFIFKKIIYMKNKKKLFGKGYKILSDLIYVSNQNINVNDLIITFNLRKKGNSKMNLKVLLNIIFFIFYNFFRKIF